MVDTHRGFNVSVFKAEINTKKLMKPNLFHVEFSIPPGLLNGKNFQDNIQTARTLEYWCEATSLPGLNFQTYPGQRFGYGSIEQRPTMPAYGEVGFDFFFDAESLNYDFFYDWMNIIINTDMRDGPNEQTGEIAGGRKPVPFELAYKADYEADTSVLLYDQEGKLVKKLVLRESFPKVIGDLRLAWGDNNSFLRLPIQFAYTDWYFEKLI